MPLRSSSKQPFVYSTRWKLCTVPYDFHLQTSCCKNYFSLMAIEFKLNDSLTEALSPNQMTDCTCEKEKVRYVICKAEIQQRLNKREVDQRLSKRAD